MASATGGTTVDVLARTAIDQIPATLQKLVLIET
jgi:hypothetical protein